MYTKTLENIKKISTETEVVTASASHFGVASTVTTKLQTNLVNQIIVDYDFNIFDTFSITIERDISDKDIFDNISKMGELLLCHSCRYVVLQSDCLLCITLVYVTSQIDILCEIYTNSFGVIEKTVAQLEDVFKNNRFNNPLVYMHYYFFEEGKVGSQTIQERIDDTFLQCSYPFIPEMQKYVQNFIQSSASILLLLGIPGSGKTRFIRYILSQMKIPDKRLDVSYTSFKQVIESTQLYKDFLFGDQQLLILEDVDYHLAARKDGNYAMYALLNASDGVISHRGTKIILSTNLSTTNTIDPALLRPGRCFDVLQFRQLTYAESLEFINAEEIRRIANSVVTIEERGHSLAELYALINTEHINNVVTSVNNKAGF